MVSSVTDGVGTFLTTPAPDDGGTIAEANLHWQAAAAAGDALRLLWQCEGGETHVDIESIQLVCEHHEDYAVICGTELELVSVKHRELTSGAWTYAELIENGGVAHLFGRWESLGRPKACRLVSNLGLKAGDPADLACACALLQSAELSQLKPKERQEVERAGLRLRASLRKSSTFTKLATANSASGAAEGSAVAAPSLDAVLQFMACLRFDMQRPHREHIAHAAPSAYARPIALQWGLGTHADDLIWSVALTIIAARMRGSSSEEDGHLAILAALATPKSASEIDEKVSRRIVSLKALRYAIMQAQAEPAAYSIAPPAKVVVSTIGLKLEAGGCDQTVLSAAEALHNSWKNTLKSWLPDVPLISPRVAQLESTLLRIASMAVIRVKQGALAGDHYGERLWLEFCESLTVERLRPDFPMPLTDDLLLGAACDLASRCRVWFSPKFDVAAARERAIRRILNAERGAGGNG